jgi:DNA-binding transcriptional regulator GbsR (MarR family)
MQIGIVEPRSVPGDRRRYYVIADDAWAHRLHVVAHEARDREQARDHGHEGRELHVQERQRKRVVAHDGGGGRGARNHGDDRRHNF